ncbi:MAG: CAP domain-containing protein [Thermoanaerobaculia bacterium]
MKRKPRLWQLVCLATSFAVAAVAVASEEPELPGPMAAAPVSGFPSWEERVLHQWINRARVEPAAELEGCKNCSAAELAPTCYTPVAPLMWRYELAVAARFHGDSMARQNFFSHETPCTLRSDLADVYPGSCDGSAECSCSGSGSTSAPSRVARFGASWAGEIIAAGYGDPVRAFQGWLLEPVSGGAPCAYANYAPGDTNGHRWLILKSSGSIGPGYAIGGTWGRYYAAEFGSGGAVARIPSGAHYPRQAPTVEFWANWFDSKGPWNARVVVGAVSHPMALARGSATNGAWSATVSGLGTGCHRYYFEFTDASGKRVRHPGSGTFGIGPPNSCREWLDSEAPAPVSSRRRPTRRGN